MLYNEARKLLIDAWNKTHNAKEIAECFSVNTKPKDLLCKRCKEMQNSLFHTAQFGRIINSGFALIGE